MNQMEDDVKELYKLSQIMLALTKDPAFGMWSWTEALLYNLKEMKQLLNRIGVE